jgi:hypothetical protein
MWFTKVVDGYQGWFTLEDNKGVIRTGAVAGDFTVTVVSPADDDSSTPVVSESTTKAGLYKFLVPSAFLVTNGVGVYAVVIEVDATTSPKVTSTSTTPMLVSNNDFDTIGDNTVLVPAAL